MTKTKNIDNLIDELKRWEIHAVTSRFTKVFYSDFFTHKTLANVSLKL